MIRWAREKLSVSEGDLDEWSTRAVFGSLADPAVQDRAVSGRIAELAPILTQPDISVVRMLLDEGHGVILLGAHLGPPCAVRYALSKLGLSCLSLTWYENEWDVASIAAEGDSTRRRSLALALAQLHTGGVFYTSLETPGASQNLTLPIFGRDVLVSRGVATLARLSGAPAVPVVAGWEGDRIRISFGERLPTLREADPDAWDRAWLTEYVRWFEEQTHGAPENLRLSGGFWREGPEGFL